MEQNVLNEDMIQSLWLKLKVALDESSFQRIFDDKRAPNPANIVYIDEKDGYAIDFYKKQSTESGLNFEVKTITRSPNKAEIESISDKNGPISSVLIAEDTIRSTPYIAFSDQEGQLDSFASYFAVLGLLARDSNDGLPEQIAGNLTYQIGHTMTLKATNRSYHLDVPALPVYTSLVRAIGVSYGPDAEEKRRSFLKLHITRSILDYSRQWENGPKHRSGLNLYPSKAIEGTLPYELPDPNTVSVALNAMLYKTEMDIAHFIEGHTDDGQMEVDGKFYTAKVWFDRAAARKKIMKVLFWNPRLETYHDIDASTEQHINTDKADAIYLLWAGVLDMHEALRQLPYLRSRIRRGGFQYDAATDLGEAPYQILLWMGLEHYKFNKLLDEAMSNWSSSIENQFAKSNSLHSSYGLYKDDVLGSKEVNAWTLASYILGKSKS